VTEHLLELAQPRAGQRRHDDARRLDVAAQRLAEPGKVLRLDAEHDDIGHLRRLLVVGHARDARVRQLAFLHAGVRRARGDDVAGRNDVLADEAGQARARHLAEAEEGDLGRRNLHHDG
jgi:hypothetical protein